MPGVTAGRGQAWGIMCRSAPAARRAAAAFQALPGRQASRRHGGAVPILRSARLQPFLSSCTPDELGLWFEGVSAYLVENQATGAFHEFTLRDGQLHDDRRQRNSAGGPIRTHFGFDAFA